MGCGDIYNQEIMLAKTTNYIEEVMKIQTVRKILLILLMAVFGCSAFAQSVKYSYKLLSKKGCTNVFTVVKQNDKFYIVVTVTSYGLNFVENPTFKVKTLSGEVFDLPGELINNGSTVRGSSYNGTGATRSYNVSTAQFEVTPEQFDILKDGISKLRLSTVPWEHEKEFKKDKLGKKLYKAYLKRLNDDF